MITQAPRSRRKLILGAVLGVFILAVAYSAINKKPDDQTTGPVDSVPAGSSSVPVADPNATVPAVPLAVVPACTNWSATAGIAAAEIDRITTATFAGGPAEFPAETFAADKAAMIELLGVLQTRSLVPNITMLQAIGADPNAGDAVRAEVGALLDRSTNASGLLGMTLNAVNAAQSAEQLSAALIPGLQSLIDQLKQPPGQPATVAFLQQFPECAQFAANIPSA